MKKIKYYFKRLFGMSFKNMFKTINKIHKRSKKSRIVIFFDMIYCSYKYLAGYTDYFLFYFEELNNKQRKTYITRGVSTNYIKYLNDVSYYKYFRDKILFNETFKEFLHRDYLDLSKASLKDFDKFVKKCNTIIVKPVDNTGGFGIEKFVVDSSTNVEELYNKLLENKQTLVEECVKQHPTLNKLCSASVNTLRIVSILKSDKTYIMLRSIRMGNGINVVDNFHSGGLFALLDEDGTIITDAADREGNVFEYHPYTKVKIKGFKVPYFKEAIDLVIEASKKIPQIKYVGFDIAISDKGPVIIEGNECPGYDIYQSKMQLGSDKLGLKPFFDEIVYKK